MQSRPLIFIFGLLLVICLGAIWFVNSFPDPAPVATSGELPPLVLPPTEPADPPRKGRNRPEPRESAAAPAEPTDEPAEPLKEWEIKIDQVLRANADESQTAQMLIGMLPTLPADGQAEAAQHISNLILDPEYARIAPMVKNPNLSEDVLDVFVTDLMNREDAVKLPILLDIAKIPNHPHHEEAVSDLEIFLDEDYGQDWTKWETAMKAYLQKQAAENRPRRWKKRRAAQPRMRLVDRRDWSERRDLSPAPARADRSAGA